MGKREDFLAAAREAIAKRAGAILKTSSLYQTASWGKTDQPDFINQVLQIQTERSPKELLDIILAIERDLGRERIEKWGSRTIDIDILFYDDEVVDESDLKIPHPNLHERAFTLVPLIEIEPDHIHPVFQKSASNLFKELDDPLSVHKLMH